MEEKLKVNRLSKACQIKAQRTNDRMRCFAWFDWKTWLRGNAYKLTLHSDWQWLQATGSHSFAVVAELHWDLLTLCKWAVTLNMPHTFLKKVMCHLHVNTSRQNYISNPHRLAPGDVQRQRLKTWRQMATLPVWALGYYSGETQYNYGPELTHICALAYA